jgi:hypothetical protein
MVDALTAVKCPICGHRAPIRLPLTAGGKPDNRLAAKLLSRLKCGAMLLADRGYDAGWIRALAAKNVKSRRIIATALGKIRRQAWCGSRQRDYPRAPLDERIRSRPQDDPLRAFSHRHHVSVTPRHQRHDRRPCEIFQGGRNVLRVVPLDHFD